MLSVVIPTHDSERTLLPTLAALVPGAAAGIVREVIVADGGSRDATAEIADVAGCRFLESGLARGARLKAAAETARSQWLLFLDPGAVPESNWIEETRRFIEDTENNGLAVARAAVFRRGTSPSRSALGEAFALLRSALGALPQPQQGLLINKRLYDQLGGHNELAANPEDDLYRRLGRRRIVLLRCGISLVSGAKPTPWQRQLID
jgi:glycosyltransferase involved in cell wall biosynthesis